MKLIQRLIEELKALMYTGVFIAELSAFMVGTLSCAAIALYSIEGLFSLVHHTTI